MLHTFQKIASGFFILLLVLSFNNSIAQSISLKDFEKLPAVKNQKEYFEKKEFVVKADSSTKEDIKLKLVKRSTREIVYVTSTTGSEGERTFQVQYFTTSADEYGKIVRAILKSGYDGKGDNRHYEKHPGSYETQSILLKEMVFVKDMEYYCIIYTYYAGKEVSETPPPAKN